MRRYDQSEIEIIQRLYPDIPSILALLPGRTSHGVYGKAGALGVRAPAAKEWAHWEVKVVVKLHPNARAIHKALPHRTFEAIKFKIRSLGIGKRKSRWSEDRQDLFLKLAGKLPDTDLAEIFGVSAVAIAGRRRQMGIRCFRSAKEAVPRIKLVEDVRIEAARRGISTSKIARALKCQRMRPSLTERSFSWKSAVRLVTALDGELYAEWND